MSLEERCELLTSTKPWPHFSIAVIKYPDKSYLREGCTYFELCFQRDIVHHGGEDSRLTRQNGRSRRLACLIAITLRKQTVNRKWAGLETLKADIQ